MQIYKITDILKNNNTIQNVSDIIKNFDVTVELLKDDIERVAKSKRIYFPDFEFAFKSGVEMIKHTLSKSKLPRSTAKFLQCENIENALKWLLSRILNNMINMSTNPNYKMYCCPQVFVLEDRLNDSNNSIKQLEVEIELKKLDRKQLKISIKHLCDNSLQDKSINLDDVEYLCAKYDFKVSDILNHDPYVKSEFSNN